MSRTHDDFDFHTTADDLALALVYLQNLSKRDTVDLIESVGHLSRENANVEKAGTSLMSKDSIHLGKSNLTATVNLLENFEHLSQDHFNLDKAEQVATGKDDSLFGASNSFDNGPDRPPGTEDISNTTLLIHKSGQLKELEVSNPTLLSQLKDTVDQTVGAIIEAVTFSRDPEKTLVKVQHILELVRGTQNLHDPTAGTESTSTMNTQRQKELEASNQALTRQTLDFQRHLFDLEKYCAKCVQASQRTADQLAACLRTHEDVTHALSQTVTHLVGTIDEFQALLAPVHELPHTKSLTPVVAMEMKVHIADLNRQVLQLSSLGYN